MPGAPGGPVGVFTTDEQIRSLLDQSITRHFLSNLTDQVRAPEAAWLPLQ